MRRMIQILGSVIIASAVICASVCEGADVKVKFSGPQGQGEIIYWAPETAVTNIQMTTNGASLYSATLHSATLNDAALSGVTQSGLSADESVVITAGAVSLHTQTVAASYYLLRPVAVITQALAVASGDVKHVVFYNDSDDTNVFFDAAQGFVDVGGTPIELGYTDLIAFDLIGTNWVRRFNTDN